jgi:PAS domain S-box-containing protein
MPYSSILTVIDDVQCPKIKEVLEAVFNCFDGIWSYSVASREISISHRLQKLIGCEKVSYSLDWWKKRIHPDEWNQIDLFFENSLYKARQSTDFELRVIDKNGDYLWLLVRCQFQKDDKENLQHVIGTVTDITPYRQLQVQFKKIISDAEQLSQAKSKFIATLNHELRSPLNGILGTVSILKGTSLQKQQQRYVDNIQASAEMLLTLVNDILDVSKIDAGKLEISEAEFSLIDTIDRSTELIRPLVEQKGIGFSISFDESIPKYMKGDTIRIQQILTNLLSNAIKFTSVGSINLLVKNLTLSSEETDDHLIYFEVKDTGIGISPENMGNLFQEFTQANVNISRDYGGTGLGLTICKKLVQLMGGEIGVESQVGQGSTFWFKIPLKNVSEQFSSIPKPVLVSFSQKEELKRNPIRILLAEDNKINQEVMTGLIKLISKDEVVIANNGEEAVSLFSQEKFDLVLMDVNMPVMDGLKATEIIRALEGGKNPIPIIAVTANTMAADYHDCLKHGMTDVMQKPVNKERLQEMLLKYGGTSSKTTASEEAETIPPGQECTLVNRETVSSLVEDLGADKVRDLFKIYEQDAIKLVHRIQESTGTEIKKEAHTLAGMSENLGIEGVGILARQIMNDGGQKSFAEIQKLKISLKNSLHQSLVEISEIIL